MKQAELFVDEVKKPDNKVSDLTVENLQKIEGKKMRSMAAQSMIGFNMNAPSLEQAVPMAGQPNMSAGQMFNMMNMAASMNGAFMGTQPDDDKDSIMSGFSGMNPYASMF